MFDQGAWALGPQPLILLLFALVLDAYVGDLPLVFRLAPHPLALMARVSRAAERRLNRANRSPETRRARGGLAVGVLAAAAAAAGWAVEALADIVPFGWIAELVVIAALLAQRESYLGARLVARALEAGDMKTARGALEGLARGSGAGDAYGLARGAIAGLGLRFSDRVVAPVFWFALLGLPGMLAFRMVDLFDATMTARLPRTRAFGAAARRLDDGLELVPARLAGLLLALAALFVPRARPAAAFRIMLRDARRHRSVNAGWPVAAMAGALDLALDGARRDGAAKARPPWLGDGRARAGPDDLRRGLFLFAVACLIDAALVGLLALGRGG